MSIHPSLRGVDTLTGERSVLTRFERVQKLAKDKKLDTQGASAWGLPKVRTKFKVVSAKKAKAAKKAEYSHKARASSAPKGEYSVHVETTD